MAPSRPDMTFPGCPTCGADVDSTDLAEALAVTSPHGTEGCFDADKVPNGWTVTGGLPDLDRLTLHPCGHKLQGDAVHLFNLAALNLTHPDLVVEVRVTIPAAANYPDRREPRLVTKSGTYSTAGLADQIDADRYIADRIHDAADAVVKMLGLIGVPEDRVKRLNAAVFEALGSASVCWSPMDCTGEFDSERASDIGRALLDRLGIPIDPAYQANGGIGAELTTATTAAEQRRHA